MAAPIPAETIVWLESSGLVDEEVELDAVRTHVGGPMAWWLRLQRRSAITTGDHISYRDERRRDDVALLVHELVHVAQYRRLGKTRFLRQYFLELAKARGHSRRLPLEAPAYERQAAARALLTPES